MKRDWTAPAIGALLTLFGASIWFGIALVGGCSDRELVSGPKKPLTGNAFEVVFTDSTGLGPLFNGNSCAECHENPLGGSGDEIERHEFCSAKVLHEFPTPEPADDTIILRSTNDLFGLGLIDQLSDDAIRNYATNEPFFLGFIDGQYWFNTPRLRTLADGRLGRFGRKCQEANLRDFVAGAFATEMGIDEGTEISSADIDATYQFVSNLTRPAKTRPRVQDPRFGFKNFTIPPGRAAKHDSVVTPPDTTGSNIATGRALFKTIGCAMCHNPETSYTDIALHNLSDNETRCGTDVALQEFRTEPLVGLGLQTRFMHDGASTTLEDAIARHGAEAGFSRAQFNHLTDRDNALRAFGQQSILAFLRSL